MQFLLDNAAAVIVLSVVALTVGLVQQRGQQASAEAVVHDMVKAKAEALMEVLKGDLQNMGAASDPFAESDTMATYFDCEGAFDGTRTTRLRFSTVDDPEADDPDPLEVEYRLDPVLTPSGQPRTVRIGNAEHPLYEMERLAGGASAGRSGAVLTRFLIEVATEDADFEPVTDCPGSNPEGSDVRAVRVSFVAALAPIERLSSDQAATSVTNVTRYGLTMHPPGMIRF